MLERTRELLASGQPLTVVTFGDSITEGYGVAEGWPRKFVRELRKRHPHASISLVNSGKSGDTAEDGLMRLDDDVLAYAPALVTINFGINDSIAGVELNDFDRELREIVAAVTTAGAEALLLSSHVLEDDRADALACKYYDRMHKIAWELKLPYADVHLAWRQRRREGKSLETLVLPGLDHPNEDGYALFARIIAELF